jgi:hypothetical protein
VRRITNRERERERERGGGRQIPQSFSFFLLRDVNGVSLVQSSLIDGSRVAGTARLVNLLGVGGR